MARRPAPLRAERLDQIRALVEAAERRMSGERAFALLHACADLLGEHDDDDGMARTAATHPDQLPLPMMPDRTETLPT